MSDVESDSHWQQNDYKSFNPSVDWDTVDFSKSPAIQDMPVTSAICEPTNNSVVKVSRKNGNIVNLKGYAWAGSGNRIIRVDLTPDKGKISLQNNIKYDVSTVLIRYRYIFRLLRQNL